MRSFVSAVPLFLPGVLAACALAAIASKGIGRRLGISPAVAALVVVSAGTVVSATLTPTVGSGNESLTTGCDLSRMGLAPLGSYLQVNTASLNVLLFVPLGIAVGLVPFARGGGLLLIGCVAAPFVIELTQLALPAMGRSCQSGDVVDNLTGLAVGFVMGLTFQTIVSRFQPRRDESPS